MLDSHATGDGDSRVLHRLLDLIAVDSRLSQRHLAQELGIALGLVNVYLNRCIKRGLIKVQAAPAKRFAYYLTPTGFAEKSRLTIAYLVHSMGFFRVAKADCLAMLDDVRRRQFARIALIGKSDLAEICIICGHESAVSIAAIVDGSSDASILAGVPVVPSVDAIDSPVDAYVITELDNIELAWCTAVERFGAARVFIPELLKPRIGPHASA